MTDDLPQRLVSLGSTALLGDARDERAIAELRAEPDIARRLRAVIDDRAQPWQARFLASEVLFRYVDLREQRAGDAASLDEAYFEALRHDYTGNGTDWGFGRDANDLGVLAQMVLDWNHDGGAFVRGLDDERAVTMQFPWGTPPYFEPPYRVKDFAALIVSRARGIALDLSGTSADRDRAIDALRR